MLVLRATKKLLRLVGPPAVERDETGTALLGCWYATVVFWTPRVVVLVNEATLLPVLMPLAPTATLQGRIADEIGGVLAAHRVPLPFLDAERQQMRDCRLGTTANRSVVGVMNEFVRLAEIYRDHDRGIGLRDLALRLATTPCSPLYSRNVSPDRELAAKLASIAV